MSNVFTRGKFMNGVVCVREGQVVDQREQAGAGSPNSWHKLAATPCNDRAAAMATIRTDGSGVCAGAAGRLME